MNNIDSFGIGRLLGVIGWYISYIRCTQRRRCYKSCDRPRDIGRCRSSTSRYLRYLARPNVGAMSKRVRVHRPSRETIRSSLNCVVRPNFYTYLHMFHTYIGKIDST